MARLTLYPTIEEALDLYTQVGPLCGIHVKPSDKGLLESHLQRPKSLNYETLFEQASALLQSLTRLSPFSSGPMVMAWALTDLFLNMNGYTVSTQPQEVQALLLEKVLDERAGIPEIAEWLSERARPMTPSGLS